MVLRDTKRDRWTDGWTNRKHNVLLVSERTGHQNNKFMFSIIGNKQNDNRHEKSCAFHNCISNEPINVIFDVAIINVRGNLAIFGPNKYKFFIDMKLR